MVFSDKRRVERVKQTFVIFIFDTPLPVISVMKHLGICFDESLTHINDKLTIDCMILKRVNNFKKYLLSRTSINYVRA